ncbi:MAG: hypothetical protein K6T83_16945 [Alicyclobacillus sp.]|nr:hypothetical protein [Alicyclobacillus sp.]
MPTSKKPKHTRSARRKSAHARRPVGSAFNERLDPRAAEAVMWAIEQRTRGRIFNGSDELNDFMTHLNDTQDYAILHETPADEAQDLVYRAFGSALSTERIRLAKQALSIYPDCADAYVILAEETDDSDEALRLYTLGMEAGEKLLASRIAEQQQNEVQVSGSQSNEGHLGHEASGSDGASDTRDVASHLKAHIGTLWGMVTCRPYLRARMGLADTLAFHMQWDDARQHYEALLELDPADHLGARLGLLRCLVFMEEYESALAFIKEHGDAHCDFAYTKAFIWYLKRGDVPLTKRYLKDAMDINQYVPFLLWDPEMVYEKIRNIGHRPDDLDDAENYVKRYSVAWAAHHSAYEWIIRQSVLLRLEDTDPDTFEPLSPFL